MSVLDQYKPKPSAGRSTSAGSSILDQYRPGAAQTSPTASQNPPSGGGWDLPSLTPDPALLEPVVTPQMNVGQPFDTMMTDEEAALLDSMVEAPVAKEPFYDASLLEPVVVPQGSQGQLLSSLLTLQEEAGLEKAEFADNLAALEEFGRQKAETDRIGEVYGQLGPRQSKLNVNLNPKTSGISGVPGDFRYSTVQGDVPVDDEYAIKKIADANLFEKPNNFVTRGIGRIEQGANIIANQLGLKDASATVKTMGELARIYPDAPENIQKGLQEIIDAKTNKDAVIAVLSNPQAVLSVLGESIIGSAPSIVAFMAGLATPVPGAGPVLGGSVSAANEFALTIVNHIQETGVNIEDTEAVLALFADQEFMAQARERGALRGIPIGVFDALSMGLAGKLTAMASAAGKSRPVVGAALTGDLLSQGAFGATGEYLAQKAEQYKKFRPDVSIGEVWLEGVAELPAGTVEFMLTKKSVQEKAEYSRLMKELNAAQTLEEQQQITGYVFDLLSPSSIEYQGEGELSVNDARVVGELDGLAERAIALGGKGNASFANGIRLKIKTSEAGKSPEIDQKYLEFIRSQVAEREADPARIAALPDATGFDVLRKFALQPNKKKQHDQQIKFDEVIADGTYEPNLAAAAAKLNEIYNAIRDAGFDPNKSVALAPDEVKALRSQISSITGTVSRLVNFQAAAIRGYKNAKDAETIDAITMDLARYIRGEGDNQGPSIGTNAPPSPTADTGVGDAGVNAKPIEDGPTTPLNPAGTADAALFGDTPAVDTGTPDATNQTGGSEPLDPNKPSEVAIDDDPAAPQEPRASTGALTEPTPAFPKPNEFGVYSEQDAKPEDKFKTEFKKGSLGGAEITVLEIEPNKWIVSTSTRFDLSGGSSPLSTAGPKYGSREEAIATSVSFLRQGAIDQPSDSKTFLAQKKKMRKFLDDVSSQIGTVPAEVMPAEPPAEVTPTEEVTPVEEVNPQAPTETPAGKPVAGKEVVSVQTPDGAAKYKVQGKVIELADLKAASGKLQPRDRNRKESDVLAKQRAGSEFNAARLLDDPTSGSGAPIIARDGTVMSGNGRVLTMQEVYGGNQPDSQAAYTQALSDAGIDTTGFSQPIYVRQLADDMTVDDLVKFASASNSKAQADMSMTERATEDAVSLNDSGIIDLYVGGEVGNSLNRKFITEFNNKIVSATEQGAFTSGGKLTREGVIRVQNAILASAFGNPDTLAGMLESTEVNIKAISNAFMSVAPKFAQLKKQINDGRSGKEWDITPQLADMANLISDLRSKNTTVKDYYNQDNMFEKTDPEVEALIKAFYNDDLTRANSQKKMEMFLNAYVDEALKKESGGFLADETTPSDVIETAKEKISDQDKNQGGLFAEKSNVKRNEAGGEQVQGRKLAGGSKNTGSRRGSNQKSNSENVSDNNRPESKASVEADQEFRATETTSDPDKVKIQGRTRGAKPGTIFDKEASTLRQSLFYQAYSDMGLDVDKTVNLPMDKQFALLKPFLEKKFGFSYIKKSEEGTKDAVDALLDAYRNLQWMTHTLGIGNTDIGLDGSLGLALPDRQWGGYLAAYINKEGGPAAETMSSVGKVPAPVVIMPGKSTSFAHEWGHALDFHILDKLGSEWANGISGRIRTNLKDGDVVWANSTPESVQEAMGDLMNVMFFDHAELAAKIMGYEQQIAKMEATMAKKGTTVETKALTTVREQLRRAKQGSTRARVGQSGYVKDVAQFVAVNKSDPNYWLMPTEMFARAFEAYVAHKVSNASITASTEFISSTREAYQLTLDQVRGADDRLALTYANEPDRTAIFLAMDKLMDQLRIEMFTGPPAEKPGDYDMIDEVSQFSAGLTAPPTTQEKRSIIEKEQRATRIAEKQVKEMQARPKKYFEPLVKRNGAFSLMPPLMEKWLRKSGVALNDNIITQLISTKRGTLFTLAARYSDNPEAKHVIEEIIKRVANDPGSLEGRVTDPDGTFEEAIRIHGRRFTTMFKSILDKYDIAELSKEQSQQLRLLLTSDKAAHRKIAATATDKQIVKAAGELRLRLLNPIYDYMRKNQLDVNYVPDAGYMPRLLDTVLAIDSHSDFKYGKGNKTKNEASGNRGAYFLYANVVYENELGQFDLGNAEQITEMLALATSLKSWIDPDSSLAADIKKLRKQVAEIESLDRQLAEADDPDAIEAKIAQLAEEMADQQGEVYEALRDPYGDASSENWIARMSEQQGMDLEAHAVQGSFTKKRGLPPEADSYMVEFYLDPVESLIQYIPAVVRKVEYNKRFGTHLVPTGFKQRKGAQTIPGMPPPSRSYLDYLLEIQGTKAGMKEHELSELRYIVEAVTGTLAGRGNSSMGASFANYVHIYGTMALLPRAVLSSIAEPMTVALNTGKGRDGLTAFAYSVDEGFSMLRSASAKERKKYNLQLANILGVIDDPSVGEMVANRLGGSVAENPQLAAKLSRFFVRTGLQGVTNAQRRASMRVGFQYLAELSAEFLNPIVVDEKSTGNKTAIDLSGRKRVADIFKDLGIRAADQKDFAQWMLDTTNKTQDASLISRKLGTNISRPDIGNIIEKSGELTDMGNLLSIAMIRFVDQSIQDPKIIDRPKYAEHPVGRIVYGIQSFIAAFTRNIHIHMAKKIKREYNNNGTLSATGLALAQVAVPAVTLFSGHLLVSTIREALLNQDKWEEERKKDNLETYLAGLALSRSGAAGRFDPVMNGIMSLKYQADLTNVLVGASPSYYLKALQRIFGVGINNSENTVSSEYQFARGVYDLVIPTAAAALATHPGYGPVRGALAGITAAAATSPTVKHYLLRNLIDKMYNVEYRPGGGHRQQKSGGAAW